MGCCKSASWRSERKRVERIEDKVMRKLMEFLKEEDLKETWTMRRSRAKEVKEMMGERRNKVFMGSIGWGSWG